MAWGLLHWASGEAINTLVLVAELEPVVLWSELLVVLDSPWLALHNRECKALILKEDTWRHEPFATTQDYGCP